MQENIGDRVYKASPKSVNPKTRDSERIVGNSRIIRVTKASGHRLPLLSVTTGAAFNNWDLAIPTTPFTSSSVLGCRGKRTKPINFRVHGKIALDRS